MRELSTVCATTLARFTLLAGMTALAACARDLPGEAPPDNAFYFPIGIEAYPGNGGDPGPSVYVLSSNFDKRYNSGWLSVVDVDDLLERMASTCAGQCAIGEVCVQASGATACRPALSSRQCSANPDTPDGCTGHTTCVEENGAPQCLSFPDYTASIVERLAVPSLAGRMAVSNDGSVAILVARGGEPITHVEMTHGRELTCGDPEAVQGLSTDQQRTDCDRDHFTSLVVELANEEDAAREDLPRRQAVAVERTFLLDAEPRDVVTPDQLVDPFAVEILPHPDDGHTVALGFLTGGFISLMQLPTGGLLQHDLLVGRFDTGVGSMSVHPLFDGRRLAATSQLLIATTTTEADLSTLYDFPVTELLARDQTTFRSIPIGDDLGGQESLDLVFGAVDPSDPNRRPLRAYLANRRPDGITILDAEPQVVTEMNIHGDLVRTEQPSYRPIGGITIPGRPSGMAYMARTSGPDRLAVASFDSDSVFILSVLGDSLRLDRRLEGVGSGPFLVQALSHQGRDLLFVSAFFSHGLTVIDATADDPQDIVVLGMVRNLTQESADGQRR